MSECKHCGAPVLGAGSRSQTATGTGNVIAGGDINHVGGDGTAGSGNTVSITKGRQMLANLPPDLEQTASDTLLALSWTFVCLATYPVLAVLPSIGIIWLLPASTPRALGYVASAIFGVFAWLLTVQAITSSAVRKFKALRAQLDGMDSKP